MLKLTQYPLALVVCLLIVPAALAEPIPIAPLTRSTPVDFDKEILPMLRRSCLACHSASDPNGELVLESPQAMMKGGDSGPAVVPGKSGDSLLLALASHRDDPVMPPAYNKAAAKPLTSQELGLLRLWIDQGARGDGQAALLSPQTWRPLPPGSHPTFAVAISPDGQFAACGRANQIFIYHVPTGSLVTRLTDPSLQAASRDQRPGIAHLDVVQSLAFNSQGDMLASGGFRTTKLWKYPRDVQRLGVTHAQIVRAVAVSADRKWVAVGGVDGNIAVWPLPDPGTPANAPAAGAAAEPRLLKGHTGELRSLRSSGDGRRLYSAAADNTVRVWTIDDAQQVGQIDVPAEVQTLATLLERAPVPLVTPTGEAGPAQAPAATTAAGAQPDVPQPAYVERLVSAGADNLVRLWKVPEYLPRTLAAAPPQSATLAASPDGRLLALAATTGHVRVIDTATGEVRQQWQAHPSAIHDMAFHVAAPVMPPADATDSANASPTASTGAAVVRLATAGEDGTVRVWNAETAQSTLVLRGSLVPVQSVDFRADGKQLVAGAADGGATVWNLEPAAVESFDNGPSPATRAVLSPDGKLLATTGTQADRPVVYVRDVASGMLVHVLAGHEGPIASLAFSNDNSKLVTGSVDKTARVWDLRDAKFPELARFAEHTGEVSAVAFNSDATQVLSGSADASLKLWAVADGQTVMSFVGHAGAIVAVAMPANNQPVSASADKTVRFWNPANGQAARTQTEAAAVTTMALSRDGNRIAVALADKSVKVYPIAGGAATHTLTGHQATIPWLAFSPDSTRLVSAADDSTASVWDLADGRLLELFDASDVSRWTASSSASAEGAPAAQPATSAATAATTAAPTTTAPNTGAPATISLSSAIFGPTADRLIVADSAGRLTVVTLRFAGALRGMTKPVSDVVFHPNGQLAITGCEDGTVRGYNVTNFQQAFAANHGAAVHDLALSVDGQRLASAGEDKLIKLWNPANGGQLQPAQLSGFTGPVHSVRFTADGQRVIGGGSGEAAQLLVFHVTAPNGVQEQAIAGHGGSVDGCVVLGQSDRAVSLSRDGKVLDWQLCSLRSFAGHTQPVTSVVAVPPQEGQPPQILSGSLDGTLRRWNVETGQPLAQLNHGGPITSIALSADLQRLASASSNNTLKLWNATNNQQLAEMRGDLRAKTLVAQRTQQKNDATAKVAAAKLVFETAEKDVPVKTTAEKTAADALAAATKDVETKAAALATATTMKADAEKVAIEMSAAAQKAATAMEQANLLALELAAKTRLLTEEAARNRASASMDPNNPTLAKLAADATQAVAAMDAQAKAAEAAKAAPTKLAADTAKLAADAAQKALATNKPYSDAAIALAQAQNVQRAARQTQEFAARDLKLATEAVPAAKDVLTRAEALLAQLDSDLAAAVKAEADAQQPLRSVAFSPDSRTLASGGDFGVVHTWDAGTGQAISSYVGHAGPIHDLAYFSNDALVSGSADKSAVVWELYPQWELQRVLGDIADPTILADRVMSVDFSEDGRLLVTGGGVPSRGGEVKIWNVEDGSLARMIVEPHTDAVNSVAFSPDGQHVASAGADKYLKTFDVTSGQLVMQFEGHTNHVLGVAWRAGGKVLASCGADGTIRTWNAETGDRMVTMEGFTKQVTSIQFVGQTQFLVSVSGEPLVRKYNSDNGGVQTNYGGATDYMYSVDATADPNNGIVVAGGHDGVLRFWNANGQVLRVIEPPAPAEDEASASDRQSSAK